LSDKKGVVKHVFQGDTLPGSSFPFCIVGGAEKWYGTFELQQF